MSYNAAMVALRSVRRRNKRRALELGYRLQDGRVEVDPYHAALGENIPMVNSEVEGEPNVTKTRIEEHGRRILIAGLLVDQPHT